MEGTDSSQRRPNTAAAATGRASRFLLARREASGDGCGVVVQRTTAALRSPKSTPTTRRAILVTAKRVPRFSGLRTGCVQRRLRRVDGAEQRPADHRGKQRPFVAMVTPTSRAIRLQGTDDSQAAGLFEAVVATVANDDVIEYCDPKNVSSRHEPTRDVDIVGRGSRRSLCGRGQWKPPITPVDTLIADT